MVQRSAVLLVANYSNNTGYAWSNIYRLFNSIAKCLAEKNVFTCISFEKIVGRVQIIDKDIPIHVFEFSPYKISLSTLGVLIRSIKEYNIKYIYFTDMPTWHWLYAMLRILGVCKIIVHCRVSVENPYLATPEKGLRKHLKSVPNHIPLLRADYVYAISEFVRHRLINKDCYPEDRVIKILNGIDVDKYSCADKTNSKNEIIIFCCARATKHKGISTLIKATEILSKKYNINNFLVQYAGSGPDLDFFKAMVKKLGVTDKFIFLGKLESTHEHACNSDIIAVPSEWGEGFGSTVAEAMAAGKAVVTTRVGGIPEIVGGEECGILLPPGDSAALAGTIAVLIRDGEVRRKLGQNARARARQVFSETLSHGNVTARILQDFEL